MKPSSQTFRSLLAVTALALLGLASCAQEVGVIDRTQAHALDKARFSGVWYNVQTITDVPLSASFGFVGNTNFGSDEGKVIFDIQETDLVAYPYSEKALGGDAKWHKQKLRTYWIDGQQDKFIEVYVGNPVGMWPIEKHFDVIRNYNPQTGAQENVLVENDTDKPWFQRKSFRVNWGAAKIANFMFPYGSVAMSTVDHYVPENEVDNPDRPIFDDDYFAVTQRIYGYPTSTGACSVYSLAPGDCSGVVFKVRNAFRRVKPSDINDYEIKDYHNQYYQDKFGFFLAERYTYDEHFGLTYAGHDYKASRWNIWQKSKDFTEKLKDDKGQPIACTMNLECPLGAVCDQADWFQPGQCAVGKRVAYKTRGIRPIVYHLSAGFPDNHRLGAYDTADGWSDTFKETVSWLLFWEEKWEKDSGGKVSSFNDPQGGFGTRYCDTDADCTKDVALAAGTFPNKQGNVVAALYTKDGAGDVTLTRLPDKVEGAGTLIAFLNASPTKPSATLKLSDLGSDLTGTFTKGEAAMSVTKAAPGTTVDVVAQDGGGTIATFKNFSIKQNESVTFVLVGGNRLVEVRNPTTAKLFRIVNGTDKTLDIGVNGVRFAQGVAPGGQTDKDGPGAIFATGQQITVSGVVPGGRSDTVCYHDNQVGKCAGWRTTLTDDDRKQRESIKKGLEEIFVVCENVYTGDTCGDNDFGNLSLKNDCRYSKRNADGSIDNPCKNFVPRFDQPKVIGDIRYNYMYWVPQAQAAAPLGYGPSAADPDTGRIFWATAYVYGSSMVTYAQYAKDLVDLLNGDLSTDDLVTGKYIRDYIQANGKSGSSEYATLNGALVGTPGDKAGPETSNAEAVLRASMRRPLTKLSETAAGARFNPQQAPELIKFMTDKNYQRNVVKQAAPTFDLDTVTASLGKIRGTDVERALINDEMKLVMSEGKLQPGDALPPEMVDKISPAGWATPKAMMDESKRMQILGYHTIEPGEFMDPAIIGLAKKMKCDPGENPNKIIDAATGERECYVGDAIRTEASVRIYGGVVEHEVGHTLGLRHNFSASSDIFNYFDPYFTPETGRDLDLVACRGIVTKSGTISADEMCEPEFGGKCGELGACSEDKDCPWGTACEGAKCIDGDGEKVGACMIKTESAVVCVVDGDCGAGFFCKAKACHHKTACSGNGACTSGAVCESGFCVDGQTGAPEGKKQVEVSEGFRKVYLPRPRMTQHEQDNQRFEWQLSTVMDYGQKINSDIHGLGKYDYAAIKFGYGDMVEIFRHTEQVDEAIVKIAKATGDNPQGVSWQKSPGTWSQSLFHPFYWMNRFMPSGLHKFRDTVPAEAVRLEAAANENSIRDMLDITQLEVYYHYCSDEYRQGSYGCYYFDGGADYGEIVAHALDMLKEYYVFDAFKRERMFFAKGGSPSSYMARIQDRWLTPISGAARYYALYNNIFRVYSWFDGFDQNPYMLGTMRTAARMSFRGLSDIIASPAPGAYKYDAKTKSYANVSYNMQTGGGSGADGQPVADLNIPVGDGKFPWTTFFTDSGYYYYDHPIWVGSYWEKIAAILTMVDSQAYFLVDYVGEQLPLFRGTSIGYNTVYPNELARILGGLAAGATDQFAGYAVNVGSKLAYVSADPFKPAPNGVDIVPPSVSNLSLRMFAAWQAVANLPAGFDPSFTDAMAVWIKGSGNAYDVDASVSKVEFTDPFGLKTYVALKPNYNASKFSPASFMVEKLNAMKGEWEKATGADKLKLEFRMKEELEILDQFRKLHLVYGNLSL